MEFFGLVGICPNRKCGSINSIEKISPSLGDQVICRECGRVLGDYHRLVRVGLFQKNNCLVPVSINVDCFGVQSKEPQPARVLVPHQKLAKELLRTALLLKFRRLRFKNSEKNPSCELYYSNRADKQTIKLFSYTEALQLLNNGPSTINQAVIEIIAWYAQVLADLLCGARDRPSLLQCSRHANDEIRLEQIMKDILVKKESPVFGTTVLDLVNQRSPKLLPSLD